MVLLRVHRRSRAIVVIGGVDVVYMLRVILHLPRMPRFVFWWAAIVITVGPFVLLHVRIQRRALSRNQLL
jgi:hypothetical protein